jgi:hypothetical protein
MSDVWGNLNDTIDSIHPQSIGVLVEPPASVSNEGSDRGDSARARGQSPTTPLISFDLGCVLPASLPIEQASAMCSRIRYFSLANFGGAVAVMMAALCAHIMRSVVIVVEIDVINALVLPQGAG